MVPRSFTDVLTMAILAVEELDRRCSEAVDPDGLTHVQRARRALAELQELHRRSA